MSDKGSTANGEPRRRHRRLRRIRRRERTRRRQLIISAIRVTVITAALLLLYCLAPLDEPLDSDVALAAILVGLGYAAIVAFQIVAVFRSPYPALRALETICVSVPLLIVLFAATYIIILAEDPDSFTQPMDRVGGIYFTVTVLATVGFGDIAPTATIARVAVTIQMLVDLAFIGIVAKVLFGAVDRRRRHLAGGEVSQAAKEQDPTTGAES